jgi:beta-lactamase class A
MSDAHADPSVELRALLSPARGVVGLAARHVDSGRVWRWNEHRPFAAASLIKLFVHAAFEAAVEQTHVDPDERARVPADAHVGGTGVLRALAPGLDPTWRDLVTLMITVSDNTATNLVLDRLEMGRVQAWITRAGLHDTRLERRMMDPDAGRAGRNNWTSAADVAALLEAIQAGRCVSAAASARMLAALGAHRHVVGWRARDGRADAGVRPSLERHGRHRPHRGGARGGERGLRRPIVRRQDG